jgi:ornithine cyclodeaminase/alanine dehydrogenase-like protein (mu-crystallin family)
VITSAFMQVFDADQIDAALTMPRLIDALALAFASDIKVPLRHHHTIARPDHDATLLLMPAWTGPSAPHSYLGTKLVNVFPGNGARHLPSIYGTYILMDGTTGAPLCCMDGARLTAWRTAAASALAARFLAPQKATRLLMVGAGALAPFLIRAHSAVRPYERITLWNHRFERAEQVAAALSAAGLPVQAVTDLESAVRDCDVVSCATLSHEPLIKGSWLHEGQHIDAVGAYRPDMRETDDALVKRARIFCDTKTGAMKEGGDLAQPLASGVIDAAEVEADLFDLVGGRHQGRQTENEITFFKSVGTAIEDLAAAITVWQARG